MPNLINNKTCGVECNVKNCMFCMSKNHCAGCNNGYHFKGSECIVKNNCDPH